MTNPAARRQELEDATLQELRRAIARGSGRVGRSAVVGRLGLSHHMALHPILAGPPMTQRAIAEAFGITPARVTGILDDLERAGAVRRERNRSDRREVLVRVTPAGHALHAEFHRSMFRKLSELFQGLTDQELQDLRALLRRIAEAPESPDDPRAPSGVLVLPGLEPGRPAPTGRRGRRARREAPPRGRSASSPPP